MRAKRRTSCVYACALAGMVLCLPGVAGCGSDGEEGSRGPVYGEEAGLDATSAGDARTLDAASGATDGSARPDAPADAASAAGDGGVVDGGSVEAGVNDAETGDAHAGDATTSDTGAGDAGTGDDASADATGAVDATVDATVDDASAGDASVDDATVGEAGAGDAGTEDSATDGAGAEDATTAEASTDSASANDAVAADATADTGGEAGADGSGPTCASAGFAAQPAAWSLPGGYAGGFPDQDFDVNGCSSSGQHSWSTFDINGDGLPDLVVTQVCFDPAVGPTQWDVYLNTGSGLASTAIAWSLPGGAGGFPEKDFDVDACSSSGQDSWSTFDIDGDGLPDLVVTQVCFDPAVGPTQWDVYLNTGSGFASTPVAWTLPAGYGAFPDKDFDVDGCSSSGQHSWSTFDIDGDGLPDLVVTDVCFDAAVGPTQWNVHRNTGSGFASSAIAWSLPGGYGGFQGKDFDVDGCDSSGEHSWSTFDIDGDALPDLVVTEVCFDAAVGPTQWNVHRNTGSGFAPSAIAWSLPGGAGGFPEKDFDVDGCDSSGEHSWSTFDADGDGLPDLVVTQVCFDPVVGTTQWNVYAGGPSGFASTPSCFPLPPGYTGGFPVTDLDVDGCSSSGEHSFSTLDMNGDRKPDLAVTQKCFDPAVGPTQWNVHVNQR